MPLQPPNRKLAQTRPDGSWNLRIFHRTAHGKQSPRYLVKCGCCDNSVEIYYDEDALEINGVNGSIENWREILLPLLKVQR
jgi:hypothetical protein